MGTSSDTVRRFWEKIDRGERTLEVFWLKVDKSGDCWVWTAGKDKDGYGLYWNRRTHRISYEALVGAIPDGLVIDHLCRNPSCVNPEHMEAVTVQKNTIRGNTIQAANAAKTHCISGHEFTEENTYHYTKKGGTAARGCRACRLEKQRALAALRQPKPRDRATHCHKGHEFTSDNTYTDSRGSRRCIECRRQGHRDNAEHRNERRRERYKERMAGKKTPSA